MQEKSGLYQVEATDELSMILHVIGIAKEERIVFLVGEEGRTFYNPANLRIIKGYAQDRDLEVAIVTTSSQLSQLCFAEQVACFPTVEEAKGVQKLLPKPRRSLRPLAWLAVLLVVGGVSYFYATQSGAVLVITPATRPWQGELVVAVEVGAFAGKGERQLTLNQSISPQGRKTVGVQAAGGTVSFFNNGSQSIKVPRGTTVVSTNGQRYQISQDLTVPKQEQKYVMTVAVGVSAGQAQAKVEAVNKGTAGNMEVGKLNTLEGPLANKLQVINTKPLTGGKDQEISIVTAADLKKLEEALHSEAKRKIQLGLPAEEQIFLADSSKLETIEFSPEGSVGQKLEKLQGTMKVTVPGHFLTKEKLAELIVTQLGEQDNWQPQANKFTSEILEIKPSAGSYLLRVECQGRLEGKISSSELTQELAGKSKSEAEKILGSLPQVDSFQLSASRNKLPRWRRFIKIVLQRQ